MEVLTRDALKSALSILRKVGYVLNDPSSTEGRVITGIQKNKKNHIARIIDDVEFDIVEYILGSFSNCLKDYRYIKLTTDRYILISELKGDPSPEYQQKHLLYKLADCKDITVLQYGLIALEYIGGKSELEVPKQLARIKQNFSETTYDFLKNMLRSSQNRLTREQVKAHAYFNDVRK